MTSQIKESVLNQREVTIEFLQLYREYRCLWDSSCKEYSNRDARNQALEILNEKLSTIDSTTNVNSVKKKIENMRASYKSERRKLLESKSTGAGADEVYVPTLWYYEYLTFLNEKDSSNRPEVDTLTCDDDESEVTEITSKSQRPIKRRVTVTKKQEMLIDAAQKMISQPENPLEAYGISTGHQLKEMTKRQRTIAEKLIADIIFYGKMDKLNINSSINLNENLSNNTFLTPSPSSSPSLFSDSSTCINTPAASTPLPIVQVYEPQNDDAIDFENDVELQTFGCSKYTLQDYVIIKKL